MGQTVVQRVNPKKTRDHFPCHDSLVKGCPLASVRAKSGSFLLSLAQFLAFDIQTLDLWLEPLDDREYDDETEDKYKWPLQLLHYATLFEGMDRGSPTTAYTSMDMRCTQAYGFCLWKKMRRRSDSRRGSFDFKNVAGHDRE